MKKFIVILLLIVSVYSVTAQHIQYRDRTRPVENKSNRAPDTAITNKSPAKKAFVEEQYMCNLTSPPGAASQLPVIINNVSPEMVKMVKERYTGRLYSITGLNMFDQRLKFKLKICDKDNGKFRSEYLDKDGSVVNDPDLDYE